MLTPKQIKIFNVFLKTPFKEFTYSEIKGFSKEKSNSIIQSALATFLKEDLVRRRKVANLFLYSVTLDNPTVFSYFDILCNEEFSPAVKKTLQTLSQELGVSFFCMVVFGSHASGKATGTSDIDIAVFVPTNEDKKACEIAFTSAELHIVHQVDFHVFTKEEFLQMLQDKFENLGKQIARKHVAVHNPMIFYDILKEGITNGFKIVYPTC